MSTSALVYIVIVCWGVFLAHVYPVLESHGEFTSA